MPAVASGKYTPKPWPATISGPIDLPLKRNSLRRGHGREVDRLRLRHQRRSTESIPMRVNSARTPARRTKWYQYNSQGASVIGFHSLPANAMSMEVAASENPETPEYI